MPEDCIFLLSFDLGGGGGQGAGANRIGVIPFCAIKNEGLHKILQSFFKSLVFFCIPISILQKSKTRQILLYLYQNIVLAVLSPLKINLYCSVLLSDHDFTA